MFKILITFAVLSCLAINANADNTPLVIWHGMGDSCCNPLSMGRIKSLIEKNVTNNIYVKSLMIGSNIETDTLNGFFKDTNEQIDFVHEAIKADPKLANGFNAIGFSQGGQFLRALAQRYPDPPMRNLISIGGQHQGIYGFPRCPLNVTSICDEIRRLLNLGAYVGFVQDRLVQAQYWHDPIQEEEYKKKSVFIAEINQERVFNETYRENLLKLKNLVLVKFNQDMMVVPRESEWFGFYKPGQGKELYTMEESVLYKNDTLGLKTLDESGRLFKLATDGDHLQFKEEWFLENIVAKFIRD